jgi:aldehyde:ferredoxin oxidoreductase
VSEETIPEEYYQKFISARGLGGKYLFDELKPGIDPLGSENKLIMLIGALGATGLQGFSKWVAMCKSPLTGTIMRSYAGGNFGVWMKNYGYDCLIVEGRAPKLTYVYMDQDGVQFLDASRLSGLDPRSTQEKIQEMHGNKTESACIGLSGEKLVKYAVITSGERTASRGGMGTLMGAKNLKAIAINTSIHKPDPYDPETFKDLVKQQTQMLKEHPRRKTMNAIGTPYITTGLMKNGILPVRNFQKGKVLHIETINGDEYAAIKKDTAGCYGCMTRCGGMREVLQGPFKGTQIDGPEYETIYAFGPLLDITDKQFIVDANALCDFYGIDTISTGVCVAFAIELFEKGLLNSSDLDGLELSWGNKEAVWKLIEKIAQREGIGDILSQGVKYAAQQFGHNSDHYAIHIKGLELPGYEPRSVKGYALSMATSNIGGSHMYGRPRAELGGKVDPFTEENKGESIAQVQKEQAIEDSLIACTFGNSGLSMDDYAAYLFAATGIKEFQDKEYLLTIGERIICLERAFNVREGFSRKDDTLPPRMFEQPLEDAGPASEQIVSNLDGLLEEYYQALGYTDQGIPKEETLQRLGL